MSPLGTDCLGTRKQKPPISETSDLLSKALCCGDVLTFSRFGTKKDSVLENKTNPSLPYKVYEKRRSPGPSIENHTGTLIPLFSSV